MCGDDPRSPREEANGQSNIGTSAWAGAGRSSQQTDETQERKRDLKAGKAFRWLADLASNKLSRCIAYDIPHDVPDYYGYYRTKLG